MARAFTGSTEYVTSALATNNDLRSYSIWTYRIGDGGNNLGRIWHKGGSAGALDTSHNNNLGASTYDYNRRFSVSNGIWAYSRPAANEWHHIVVVHDSSSDANDPVIYLDGSIQSLDETQTPSGTRANNSAVYAIGNRSDDGSRGWDGYLAEFAVWNRLLTEAEAVALSKGITALALPSSLIEYLPLQRDLTSRFLAPATNSSTTVAPHPRIQYSFGFYVGFAQPVAAAEAPPALFRGRNISFFDDEEVNRYEFWRTITSATTAYKDIATRFILNARGYSDTATRFIQTVRNYSDTATRFIQTVRGYSDTATRFVQSVRSYSDTATRFKLTVRSYADTATRFVLNARSYADTATRFIQSVRSHSDTSTRFNQIARQFSDASARFKQTVRAYTDTATRFVLSVRNYSDTATRFIQTVRGYSDVATRFVQNGRSYADAATRFILETQNTVFAFVNTRFVLWGRSYSDAATRFLQYVRGYKDVSTRFNLTVRSYADIATRFIQVVRSYKDASTRFILTARAYSDTATRFIGTVRGFVDAGTRFYMVVQSYSDTATRVIIALRGYADVGTRMVLLGRSVSDASTRFKQTALMFIFVSARFVLVIRGYTDTATRFGLVGTTYADTNTRFILEFPLAPLDTLPRALEDGQVVFDNREGSAEFNRRVAGVVRKVRI